jgi:hypothetical protein
MPRVSYFSRMARAGKGATLAPGRVLFSPAPQSAERPGAAEPMAEALESGAAPVQPRASRGPTAAQRETSDGRERPLSAHRSQVQLAPREPEMPQAGSGTPREEVSPAQPPAAKGSFESQVARLPEDSATPNPTPPRQSTVAPTPSAPLPGRRPQVSSAPPSLATRQPSREALVPPPQEVPKRLPVPSFHSAPAAEPPAQPLPGTHPHPAPVPRRPEPIAPVAARPSPPGSVRKPLPKSAPPMLVPPPPAWRIFPETPGSAKETAATGGSGGIHIGSLEVRVTPPEPVLRRAPAAAPRTALSRGFQSFGLTQS